jgi:transcriptional antiterminator NusG
MKNWYALFVKTGYESLIERHMSGFFFPSELRPLVPTVERIVKLPNLVKKETKTMFPGYLFVDTDIDSVEFYRHALTARWYLQEIIRVVRYGTAFHIAITSSERELLDGLLGQARCLEASKGIIAGDAIYITEGPLIGRESIIRHIDRHKRRATIELDILGAPRRVEVALEIVAKF